MSSLKNLAGQTLWYGVPTIASRFLGYATTLMLFWLYKPTNTAPITQLYAIIPFLNILYTYGLETSYFRFAQETDKKKLYNLLSTLLICSTCIFTAILLWFAPQVANAIAMPNNAEFVKWMAWILFFDTLSVMPFVKLRQEGKPRKYAFIKVVNIATSVALTIFFLGVCPKLQTSNPTSFWLTFYNPNIGIGYYILANVFASVLTLVMLYKEFITYRFTVDSSLFKKIMNYSYPLVIVGFGGMINEMLSRLVYTRVLDLPEEQEQHQLGVFGANYKVAVLITIFIQVFRMGAEPFFFNKSTDKDAPKTYAKVMKYFVIICCIMWLTITVNLQLIKHIAYGKNAMEYSEGLSIIPILAMGSVFLGIYYNLSVWYKLTNKTLFGAYITVAGAVITVLLNIWLIPIWGYNGSAWATFFCYLFMMIISFTQGQKHYPIPYTWKKLVAYIIIVVLLFCIQKMLMLVTKNVWFELIFGNILVLFFLWFVLQIEKKDAVVVQLKALLEKRFGRK